MRGTSFLFILRGNAATIKVLRGTVNVANVAQKGAMDVKAGYQVIVTGQKVGKPTKATAEPKDAWYNQIPPREDFFNYGWAAMSTVPRWACGVFYPSP